MASESRKWAVITVHPWLPSRSEQVARARAWGVEERRVGKLDISNLIVDDVSKVKRTTNWVPKLENRFEFIKTMKALKVPGDVVFFANPLCVGFSAKVAEETIAGLWDAGLKVYVHAVDGNGPAIYSAGDDMTEFYETITRLANNAHQRKFKSRVH